MMRLRKIINGFRTSLAVALLPAEERATLDEQLTTLQKLIARLGPLGIAMILDERHTVHISERGEHTLESLECVRKMQ